MPVDLIDRLLFVKGKITRLEYESLAKPDSFKNINVHEFNFKPCKNVPTNEALQTYTRSNVQYKDFINLFGICIDATPQVLE